MTTLREIARGVAACIACPLARQGRTNAVPGEGPETAEVMFIGEAPGYYEDKQARPFVGQAGKFLDELLATAGMKRDEVYITNIVKSRPPNNRDPLPFELETCQGQWLRQEIALLKPKVIVTLGRFSLAYFLPREPISRVHGKAVEKDGVTVYPSFHPAAALHQQRFRATIIEDFTRLPQVLAQARERRQVAAAPPTIPPRASQPEQLRFF